MQQQRLSALNWRTAFDRLRIAFYLLILVGAAALSWTERPTEKAAIAECGDWARSEASEWKIDSAVRWDDEQICRLLATPTAVSADPWSVDPRVTSDGRPLEPTAQAFLDQAADESFAMTQALHVGEFLAWTLVLIVILEVLARTACWIVAGLWARPTPPGE